MVRAINDDRKSQTRRLLKPQPSKPFCGISTDGVKWWTNDDEASVIELLRVPYAVGDMLWVREAWRTEARFDSRPPRDVPKSATLSYEADYDREPNDGCRGRYRHARFMPRWASRITLRVTDVRVQRLQEISEEDAKAEGVEPLHGGYYPYGISTFMTVMQGDREVPAHYCPTARQSFQMLWNHINGPGAWEASPWVAAYTFERVAALTHPQEAQ